MENADGEPAAMIPISRTLTAGQQQPHHQTHRRADTNAAPWVFLNIFISAVNRLPGAIIIMIRSMADAFFNFFQRRFSPVFQFDLLRIRLVAGISQYLFQRIGQ